MFFLVIRGLIGVILFALTSQAYGQINMASGLGANWVVRKDYGEQNYYRLGFEIPTYLYIPIAKPFYGRGGLRLGYSSDQPEMPQSIKIEERDVTTALEFSLLYDWYVVPSLSFDWGYVFRTVELITDEKIDVPEDNVSGSETLGFVAVQLGLGVPIFDGSLVFEPYARYWNLERDERSHWIFGFEFTFQYL